MKTVKSSSITLVKNDAVLREKTIIAEASNIFFTNIVPNLEVHPLIGTF